MVAAATLGEPLHVRHHMIMCPAVARSNALDHGSSRVISLGFEVSSDLLLICYVALNILINPKPSKLAQHGRHGYGEIREAAANAGSLEDLGFDGLSIGYAGIS